MRVVGLDISMTACGIAVHEPGGLTFVRQVGEKGSKDATLAERRARQQRTTSAVLEYALAADFVAVEAHSFTTKSSAFQHDLSGQWWAVVGVLIDAGIPVAEIEVQRLKGYLCGSGIASKNDMVVTAVRRYPTVDIRTDNHADAIAACSMAVRHLELAPLEDVWNQRMAEEMSKVRWPS